MRSRRRKSDPKMSLGKNLDPEFGEIWPIRPIRSSSSSSCQNIPAAKFLKAKKPRLLEVGRQPRPGPALAA